ncbi:multicopper oxidase family protein [Methylocapsa palsarum]|uniref:Multicopper oxidase with three cupredoxin domains (Includes cell division protein FtsP and spore coat protein CotA) n=1 Tax=Methylocapsa palsarum TaxID=1612308 RepID=A0A1I3XR72_9HYPH|nr:multicopper oxidase family protein [Methylocapsa palsarum]SFK22147.1 Multicopper oxidase with three cupredoxin domains (includes cell division protein FtsP and spore coat protein CotA) [Methylocapsa palsarum]
MLTRRKFLGASLAAGTIGVHRGWSDEVAPAILRIENRTIEVNGKAAPVFGIRQPDGSAGLIAEAGQPFRVRVENRLNEPSILHWHGLTPPWRQDGVHELDGGLIAPGASADYDFPLRAPGTFFMHSHHGLQEQQLLSAPLIVREAGTGSGAQDVIVMLADFSFTPPEELFARLRDPKSMANMNHMDMTPEEMAAMPGMAGMSTHDAEPDINDIDYDAFLANDRTLRDPEVVKVEAGGPVRLRIINASAMSGYHLDLGELQGRLAAVDGHAVVPVFSRTFPIVVGQRLDIELNVPPGAGAYPILATLEGGRKRTGIVLRAGAGTVTKLAEEAASATPAITLGLEAWLRAAAPPPPRPADRAYDVNLTGSMAGYQWSIDDVAWTETTPPLLVRQGERVELTFVNKTSMAHPMHLHGHDFQVVAINGDRFAGAVRDTVLAPPKTSVTIAFDANNPGWWAIHCHMAYHMAAGMFTTIRYG